MLPFSILFILSADNNCSFHHIPPRARVTPFRRMSNHVYALLLKHAALWMCNSHSDFVHRMCLRNPECGSLNSIRFYPLQMVPFTHIWYSCTYTCTHAQKHMQIEEWVSEWVSVCVCGWVARVLVFLVFSWSTCSCKIVHSVSPLYVFVLFACPHRGTLLLGPWPQSLDWRTTPGISPTIPRFGQYACVDESRMARASWCGHWLAVRNYIWNSFPLDGMISQQVLISIGFTHELVQIFYGQWQ